MANDNFVGRGGFAAVSSQFLIFHTYDSPYTKGEPLNFVMKAVTPRF